MFINKMSPDLGVCGSEGLRVGVPFRRGIEIEIDECGVFLLDLTEEINALIFIVLGQYIMCV